MVLFIPVCCLAQFCCCDDSKSGVTAAVLAAMVTHVLKLCRGLDWCVRTPAGVVRWCLVGGGAADALATTATTAAAIATTTAQP